MLRRHLSVFLGVLLASTLLAATAGAGNNRLAKLCRGGFNHGESCSTDSDCINGVENGVCRILGHPAYCSFKRYCAVSTNAPCEDNLDCPLYPGSLGRGVSDTPNSGDYCVNGNVRSGNDGRIACTTDSDCKQCVGGPNKGNACTVNGECPSSTCGIAGSGTCILGVEQAELYTWRSRSGFTNDLVPDWSLGRDTLESGETGTNTRWSFRAPTGVEYDPATGTLWACDPVRCLKFPAISGQNQDATVVLGQSQFEHQRDERLPGEISQDALALGTRRTHGWTYSNLARIHKGTVGSAEGIWVANRYRIYRYPLAAATNEAAIAPILGFGNLDGTVAPTYGLTDHQRIALQDRCVGGAAIGTPCTSDGDCAASTCRTTLCATISGNEIGTVACWRDVGHAANGSAPDFALGSTSATTKAFCTGTPSATVLCRPQAIDFAPDGAIWVADTGYNRVVKFAKSADTNASIQVVIGQPNKTTSAYGNGTTGLISPGGVSVSPDTGSILVADTFNNRILLYDPQPTSDGAAAISVVGQPGFGPFDTGAGRTSSSAGTAAAATLCDRLNSPTSVVWAGGAAWVADFGNGRVFRFSTPDITGSGQNAVGSLLQGQPSCRTAHSPIDAGHPLGVYSSGGSAGTSGGRWCFADSYDNRVMCWGSTVAAIDGETFADQILGQGAVDEFEPNRGGTTVSASTMNTPAGVAWWAGNGIIQPGLYVADSLSNRVIRFQGSTWTSGQAANNCFGQGGTDLAGGGVACNLTTSAPGTAANAMNEPRGIAVDSMGDLWVADYRNGRVLMFCGDNTSSGYIPKAGGGFVCNPLNSNDPVADLVLGKTNFTTAGCDCSPSGTGINYACTTTTASTLCGPSAVDVDSTNLNDIRVYVTDIAASELGGQGNASGRVLVYQPGSWSVTGQAANVAIGARPGATFTSYEYWGRGTCENSLGQPSSLECNYVEPEGATAGTGGKICVGGANALTVSCTNDGQCPGGTCGCPTGLLGGFCSWSRIVADAVGVKIDTTHQIMYVASNGGGRPLQFIGPFVSNMAALRVGLRGRPHRFWTQGGDFTEGSYGGSPYLNSMGLDSENNLYSGAGPYFGADEYRFDAPVPETPTFTATITRTPTLTVTLTRTPTVTNTPTNTPTVTMTFTGSVQPTATPTNTPTYTATATNTVTPSPTPTPTSTFTVTPTVTGVQPSSTPTSILNTPTATPVIAHSQPLKAEGYSIPDMSSCTLVNPQMSGYKTWVVRCPGTGMAEFIVKFHVPQSMTRNVLLEMYLQSDLTNDAVTCWNVENTVNVPEGHDATSAPFGALEHIFPLHSGTIGQAPIRTGPTLITLWNAKTGGACADDDVCDNATGYLKFTRISGGLCADFSPSTVEDIPEVVLSWPDVP